MEGMKHTVLLKNWILVVIEDMKEHLKGSVGLLIFNKYIGDVLKPTISYSLSDESHIIAITVRIFRTDMHETKNRFKVTLDEGFRHESDLLDEQLLN